MKSLFAGALLLGTLVVAPEPATSHKITLSGDAARNRYGMFPVRVRAAVGDTLAFTVQSGAPHAIALGGSELDERARAAWNRALPRRVGDLRGPLLSQNDTYLVVVPRGMPPGSYRFFCQTHRAYDSEVTVTVR